MKKVVRLTEADLARIVKRVIKEQTSPSKYQINQVYEGIRVPSGKNGPQDLDSKNPIQYLQKEIDEKWGASVGIECTVQLFSSLKKQGVDEVETVVGKWLNTPVNHVPNFVA